MTYNYRVTITTATESILTFNVSGTNEKEIREFIVSTMSYYASIKIERIEPKS